MEEVHKFDLLYSQDVINKKIQEIGKRISSDYAEKNPVLIGVLKGCFIFMADLVRNITVPIEIEFISASSYVNGQERNGNVAFFGGPDVSIKGRHVLIVEAVVDSGKTAQELIEKLNHMEPESVEIVTLLDKTKCREVKLDIKYRGFDAGDDFVIGYGLDESQKYRNLPFIGKVIDK